MENVKKNSDTTTVDVKVPMTKQEQHDTVQYFAAHLTSCGIRTEDVL